MFHCTILFALKSGVSLFKVRAAREALQALIETMPGVAHLTVTHNIADERQGYNLALFSGFESKEACEIFFRHPEYERVMREELDPVVDQKLIAKGVDES
ncbi:MAG: heme-degrading monooxygenase HmoA [Hyphomicrobiaceae bacterium]|jgi:heme-degrading monooxygenase HmoA